MAMWSNTRPDAGTPEPLAGGISASGHSNKAAVGHSEYRRHSVPPGMTEQLLARFEEATLAIWDDLGLRPAGFWRTAIGRSSDLHYLLAWDSLDDRADKLRAFRADPRWLQARADSEQDGPLIQYADNQLWTPTRFSALQ